MVSGSMVSDAIVDAPTISTLFTCRLPSQLLLPDGANGDNHMGRIMRAFLLVFVLKLYKELCRQCKCLSVKILDTFFIFIRILSVEIPAYEPGWISGRLS